MTRLLSPDQLDRWQPCSGVKGRPTMEIDHPPGEEIQWDWFERRHAPGPLGVWMGKIM
ncbi:MAG: hypothetical protein ACR2HR_18450 [Euzebya sp.]